MAKNKGFVSVYRDLQDHYLWKDKPFARGQAWIDLIMLANHTEVKDMKKGRLRTFKRGTVNHSIGELAQRWGWSWRKSEIFINQLVKDEMVLKDSTPQGTTLTIVNYDVYQLSGGTLDRTQSERKVNTRQNARHINNKDNNDKKMKEKEPSSIPRTAFGCFSNIWLSDEELQNIQDRYSFAWEESLDNMSRWYADNGIILEKSKYYPKLVEWIEKDQGKKQRETNEAPDIDHELYKCKYGQYSNIFLTDTQYKELLQSYPRNFQKKLEEHSKNKHENPDQEHNNDYDELKIMLKSCNSGIFGGEWE